MPLFGSYDFLSKLSSMLPWRRMRQDKSDETHLHGRADMLRNLVFGVNDGLVSNVSLVAAVAGATTAKETILLGGTAGLVAGSLSMALGAYVSTRSEREFRESEESRERWEIEHLPHQERGEIRQIYRRKGLKGPLLETVVEQLTRDKEQWLELMMSEELGFAGDSPRPVQSALIIGIAFVAGAALPVIPYLFAEGWIALVISLGLAASALFLVGAWRAYLTNGDLWKKAIEMVLLASIAVAVANAVGRLVGASIA